VVECAGHVEVRVEEPLDGQAVHHGHQQCGVAVQVGFGSHVAGCHPAAQPGDEVGVHVRVAVADVQVGGMVGGDRLVQDDGEQPDQAG